MSMDAVIYVRVSTDDQAKMGTSLATQETECRTWCKHNGYEVTHVFVEAGESAKTADRPQFLALVDWCRKYKPAACVVWKYDRWARNSTDHGIYEAALIKSGTKLVSATEPASDDPAGRLLVTMLSAMAQFDNEVRSQRVRTAMRAVAQRGGWITCAPFGYRCSRAGTLPILIPHPDKAAAALDMFTGIAEGRRNVVQTIAIAREWKLSANACREMLKKPVYAGFLCDDMTDQREVETAFPGIVSRPIWDRVQDVLAGRRVTVGAYLKQRDEFPLRGLLICHACGRHITSGWSKGRGCKYPYYACRCGQARVRAEVVHQSWLDLLAANAKEFNAHLDVFTAHVDAVLAERMTAGHKIWRKSISELKRLQDQRKRLMDAYVEGFMDQDAFIDRQNELSAKIRAAEELQNNRETFAFDVKQAVMIAARLFSDPVGMWARLDLRDRRRFAGALYDGKLILTPSGIVEPPSGAGLTGVIRAATDPKTELAYLAGELRRLVQAVQVIADLAA